MLAGLLVLCGLLAGACGSGPDGGSGAPATGGRTPRTVRVLVASSLAGVAPALSRAYERTHPGTRVEWSAAASSALVAQVRAGAPADAVVLADRATADAVAPAPAPGGTSSGGPAADPRVVASNVLVLAVPATNPGGVRTLADLARPDLLVGLCAPQVPCGRYARDLLRRSGVTASVDTEEPDARSLMAKVASGDLDAALVYRTDVRSSAGRARAVSVPAAADVPVRYFSVARSADGRSFTGFLEGRQGQRVLRSAGFGPP